MKSKLAKIGGYVAGGIQAAQVLYTNGFHLGSYHGTDFLQLISAAGLMFGIHQASNTANSSDIQSK